MLTPHICVSPGDDYQLKKRLCNVFHWERGESADLPDGLSLGGKSFLSIAVQAFHHVSLISITHSGDDA